MDGENRGMKTMRVSRRRGARLALIALGIVALLGACQNDILLQIVQDVETARAASAPLIQSTVPAANAAGVEPGATVSATFSGALGPSTLTTSTFLLAAGTTQVTGSVTYEAALNQVVFTPAAPLSMLTVYTATLAADITSARGVPLQADYSWTFTTRAALAPVVEATNPPDAEANAATSTTVWASFNTPLDPSSVSGTSFKLARGTVPVAGVVTYDVELRRAIFTPDAALSLSTTYTATLTTDVRSAEGAPLVTPHSWSFTTFAANPTEIVVNLSYVGPYELSVAHPMYLQFFANPMPPTDPETPDPGTFHWEKLTSAGSAVVAVDELPASPDSVWVLVIIHDLNNNYDAVGGSDGMDAVGYFGLNGTTNVSFEPVSDGLLASFSPITFVDAAELSPGNAYAVEFNDPPVVAADSYEIDDLRGDATALTLGQGQIHSLGWNDVDWVTFIVPAWDEYRVEVIEQSQSVAVRLSVYKLEPDGSLSGMGQDGDGYPTRVEWTFAPSTTYYAEVTALDSTMGEYSVRYRHKPPAEDAFEPDGSIEEVGVSITLPYGRTFQTRSLHETDTATDWMDTIQFAVDYPNVAEAYALEARAPVYPYYDRGVQLDPSWFLVTQNNTNYGGFAEAGGGYPTLMWNQLVGPIAGGTYYAKIAYGSGTRSYYRLRLVAGPDYGDLNNVNPTFNSRDDTLALSAASGMSNVDVGVGSYGTALWRSIYPAGDVDYVRFYANTSGFYSVRVWPAGHPGAIEARDGIQVVFDVRNSADVSITGGGQYLENPSVNVVSAGYHYIVVQRTDSAQSADVVTGAYTVQVEQNP